ncbi:MAG: diaminopimelate epimerase [Flavobacteriaceae bacterium]
MNVKVPFYKYHGAGNDFVIIDRSEVPFELNAKQINQICERRYGVGADGLMFYDSHNELDFKMTYFNSDGSESSFCGNGARCIVQFGMDHKGLSDAITFDFNGTPLGAKRKDHLIEINMSNVSRVERLDNDNLFLDTGSPHQIVWVPEVNKIEVEREGRALRYAFSPAGCNVNFVELLGENKLAIRTYERGVEAETHACGTGITAAAIAAYFDQKIAATEIELNAVGGMLWVRFEPSDSGFVNVYLTGPAIHVFTGFIELK